ncbi:MAG TPA: hypothetical protein VHX60_16010 [Acidobacteriaceae bacterium]|jgi:hypothetical protein|nr:hypothetical protein [Acidobacteriaceae bacterium]
MSAKSKAARARRRLRAAARLSQQPPLPAKPLPKHKPAWLKVPRWLWASASALLAVVVGLHALYPSLSINDDYSFDQMFPYNTSFSISNEGIWPITDVSATCGADFTMLPWTTDPNDKSKMDLHTEDDNHANFAHELNYRERVTLPCNHNVVANGHRIAPGARLTITVSYRLKGTGFRHSQTFKFQTVAGWNGQQFWQYGDYS